MISKIKNFLPKQVLDTIADLKERIIEKNETANAQASQQDPKQQDVSQQDINQQSVAENNDREESVSKTENPETEQPISQPTTLKERIKKIKAVEILTKAKDAKATTYPFKVALTPQNKIKLSVSSGTNVLNITSSTSVTASVYNHVICRKYGSNFLIAIDGTTESSGVFSQNIDNTDSLFKDISFFLGLDILINI